MVKKLQVFEAPSITVSFDPNVCRHSGVCVRTLPAAFDTRRARWIDPAAAGADEVAAAVQKCPSGALQFYSNPAGDPAATARARGYDFVGIYDVLPAELAVVGWHGEPPVHQRFSRDSGLCGAAVKSGMPQLVNDVTLDPRYLPTSVATRSELIVPVVNPATQEVVGTIDVASNRCDTFGGEDVTLVEAFSRAVASLWTEHS